MIQGVTSKGVILPPPSSGVIRPLNPPPSKQQSKEDWGDFASFGDSADKKSSSDGGGNWVQF